MNFMNSTLLLEDLNFYKVCKEHNIDVSQILSKKLLPDECYLDFEQDELRVYEKKYQQTEGSVDEKPQTCAFKIFEFKVLCIF